MDATAAADLPPVECSAELLAAYRTGGDPKPFLAALADYDDTALQRVRTDRETALAFWVNCYNAGTQRLLSERPGHYESSLRFLRFFGTPALTVAGQALSLDDVEQGLLRRRSKYGLGYLPRLLPDTFEMRYRLEELDPRIHFALNCGAESCPAIRAYTPEAIDDQLDLATRAYLDATVEYDPEAGRVRVPRVMLWYRGDFGGARGIRKFLRGCDLIPADASPSVSYHAWDWSQSAGKFASGPR
jgi:hypothetical protein